MAIVDKQTLDRRTIINNQTKHKHKSAVKNITQHQQSIK